jgi:hypothetical protein
MYPSALSIPYRGAWRGWGKFPSVLKLTSSFELFYILYHSPMWLVLLFVSNWGLWLVTPCIVVVGYQLFGGPCCNVGILPQHRRPRLETLPPWKSQNKLFIVK